MHDPLIQRSFSHELAHDGPDCDTSACDLLPPGLAADLDELREFDRSLRCSLDDELQRVLKRLEVDGLHGHLECFDVDAALANVVTEPTTKVGDLWLLGPHRLLCGDSTREEHLARLFAGEQAVMMHTDPPYLVDYNGGNHPLGHADRVRATTPKQWIDYHDPPASVEFYSDFLRVALSHLAQDAAIYQWHANRRQALVEQAWQQNGLQVHQSIVWVKSKGVLTHNHYLWRHEPCFYGWRVGHSPKLRPPANAQSVWQISQDGDPKGLHPTIKPVEIFLRPIGYHTRPGDIVYEPFSGSGTQLIAAERAGRICYAMEREPRYVDVAVRRWEAFTAQSAVRVGGSA